jgi:arylamine N-acetyltransferase
MNADPLLDPDLVVRIKTRLGISGDLTPDLEGLRTVYAAWCSHVPFDNIRKMISLHSGEPKLAGLDAADFFENYLLHGTGGTCWPSSNALYVLLKTIGFDARRVAGAMFDVPDINHGTVKVRIDGHDWMVDTSMLTYEPIELTDRVVIRQGPVNAVEAEPDNGSYVIWADFPPLPEFIPCRLHRDPVDDELYHERYEIYSREYSPFNEKIYRRSGGPEGVSVLFGNGKFTRLSDGTLAYRELDGDTMANYLVDEAGVSRELVDQWMASGALESTFANREFPPSPEIARPRPSRR